ncbi:putative endonuclease MutS2 [Helianthus anomalus]
MNLCNFFFFISPTKPSLTLTTRSFKCSSSPPTSHQLQTLNILEWPSVCNQLSAFTSTTMGSSTARDGLVVIGRSPQESRRLLDQTSAAFALHLPPDFSGIEDVSDVVESAVFGQLLSIREICAVKRTLQSARALFEELEKIGEQSERYTTILCTFSV